MPIIQQRKRLSYAVKLLLLCLGIVLWSPTQECYPGPQSDLDLLIGERDAVYVEDVLGRIIYAKNADRQLVPASTLKILTALVARFYLGPDYRFETDFYLDDKLNLIIKGTGDPLLVSERLIEISKILKSGALAQVNKINDLVLDDSYFAKPILIPGRSVSSEPYDAPNGALCVNFNTVNFRRDSSGALVSGESQTPLLPFALGIIRRSAYSQGRVVLSHEEDEITLYAGHLMQFFFLQEGIHASGNLRIERTQPARDQLIYKYIARQSLDQVISRLLEYSNNFMANQLFIAAGAKAYGPPGTLEKGVRAAKAYISNVLGLTNTRVVEGSGISRTNRISATDLNKILEKFEPYRRLMRRKGRAYYKTGHLKGVQTRAGFIEYGKDRRYRFVVLINTPGKSINRIMLKINRLVNHEEQS